MSESDDAVGWQQLREFGDVDLSKSYILSWAVDGETLKIDVDMVLKETHAFYEKPRPREKICIRPAIIEFPYCESVTLNSVPQDETMQETVQRLGLGAIRDFRRINDGPFEIHGEFGVVCIDSDRPLLRLRGV